MTFYIQYDESGNISATINTGAPAPDFPRQIVFDTPVETTGKCVNLTTLELDDLPNG
jgi:hypothetical protein